MPGHRLNFIDIVGGFWKPSQLARLWKSSGDTIVALGSGNPRSRLDSDAFAFPGHLYAAYPGSPPITGRSLYQSDSGFALVCVVFGWLLFCSSVPSAGPQSIVVLYFIRNPILISLLRRPIEGQQAICNLANISLAPLAFSLRSPHLYP